MENKFGNKFVITLGVKLRALCLAMQKRNVMLLRSVAVLKLAKINPRVLLVLKSEQLLIQNGLLALDVMLGKHRLAYQN